MLLVSETIAQSQQTDTSKMNIIILMKSENFAGCFVERAKVILQRSLSHDRGLTQTQEAFLDKDLCNDHFCLVASNIKTCSKFVLGKSQNQPKNFWKCLTPKLGADLFDSATVAFSWQEEKDAPINRSTD